MNFEVPFKSDVPISLHIFCALVPIMPFLAIGDAFDILAPATFFALLFYAVEFYFLKVFRLFKIKEYFSYPIFLILVTAIFYYGFRIEHTCDDSVHDISEIKKFFCAMFIMFFPSLMPFLARVMAATYHFAMFKFEQKMRQKEEVNLKSAQEVKEKNLD